MRWERRAGGETRGIYRHRCTTLRCVLLLQLWFAIMIDVLADMSFPKWLDTVFWLGKIV
ncbi:hypothetical protein COCSADRAFT_298476 [Bipolaris sorokiniana ND90Pr]|uniref:Uncharacterized protein n=1 Tax=Cochliobolus sativus (strain ND90Pr / ATCC 201652) TaxID=665912 RepID=M2SVY8_COCSN|nr:uncharacterized protein COCSADRAFT_298476 [Bipolaris sorokiniana ND90Pr]EMD66460.1 hypothetical protein COCSADRAFT_298476 [Bipolaris sorokiniana ND90Pr]